MRYKLSFAIPLLALAATACELQPGQPDHITVAEIEAPWITVAPPTQLWVQMITEADWRGRCRDNFGGVPFNDSRGFICEVGPRPTRPTVAVGEPPVPTVVVP